MTNQTNAPPFYDVRPELEYFARVMESVLKSNDHKGGWEKCDIDFFEKKLDEEFDELVEALMLYKHDKKSRTDLVRSGIMREAADLANICMMIHDNLMKERI